MGVALYVESYEKKQECITGYIKCLEWYEVDLDKISSCRLKETMVLHNGIHSIDVLLKEKNMYEYGFYDISDFSFYHKAMNNLSGRSLRNENGASYGLMYEPSKILETIRQLYETVDSLKVDFLEEIKEKESLGQLCVLLEKVSKQNGLVGFTWG